MYDTEMKYCPSCDDEYMPTVEVCGVCGAALLNGDEMRDHQKRLASGELRGQGPLTANDDIATVFKGPMLDVKRLEAKFNEADIGTRISGDKPSCGKGCCAPEVELKIRRQDGAAALRIIEEDFNEMTGAHEFISHFEDKGFDPSKEECLCPACGCRFSTENSTCPDCGLCFA